MACSRARALAEPPLHNAASRKDFAAPSRCATRPSRAVSSRRHLAVAVNDLAHSAHHNAKDNFWRASDWQNKREEHGADVCSLCSRACRRKISVGG